MAGLEGQIVNTSMDMGILSVSDKIYHLYGNISIAIPKPESGRYTTLILHAEYGNFRLRIGDLTASLTSYADPSATVSNGSGSLKLVEGQPIAITAPAVFTVVGDSSSAILTYYWI